MTDEPRKSINLPFPHDAAEREQWSRDRLMRSWDGWYASLPDDLRRRLSLHDFKRLGECFRLAFGVKQLNPPPSLNDWLAASDNSTFRKS